MEGVGGCTVHCTIYIEHKDKENLNVNDGSRIYIKDHEFFAVLETGWPFLNPLLITYYRHSLYLPHREERLRKWGGRWSLVERVRANSHDNIMGGLRYLSYGGLRGGTDVYFLQH